MLQLNTLKKLVKKKQRIGRGGSRGGTSGKGGKGQTARSGGKTRRGFEGGQMPIARRLPKRGFSNDPFRQEVKIINLQQIEDAFEVGAQVDRGSLIEKGLLKLSKGAKGQTIVKILGQGSLTKKVTIVADAFSKSALQAIEKVGGKAQLTKEI
jgi:large subunit ribosomal protein L15